MQNENSGDASGTNTVLIVIVLMILVAFGAWWVTTNKSVGGNNSKPNDLNIKVDLPSNTGGSTNPPAASPSPSPTTP